MRRRRRISFIANALLVAGALGVAAAAPAQADAAITSSGPLTSIAISDDLNCAVMHSGDSNGEWYSDTACGTLVAIGSKLYGPQEIPAGGNAVDSPGYTPYTSITPPAESGSGTTADPFTIRTKVGLGTTGITLAETDTYIVGQESYRTSVTLSGGSTATTAIIYRAGDCYLQDSDVGLGQVQNGTAPICKAQASSTNPNRIEGLYPLTSGSHYLEAFYGDVWAALGAKTALPDTCRCTDNIDNGAALSWTRSVPAGGSVTVDNLTIFSPLGGAPLTFTKTADAATAEEAASDGYTVKVTNPGALAETLTTITDTLPAGFTYAAGSTTGATTTDPTASGQQLTYTGSFAVPAATGGTPGSLSLHFGVHVSSTPGTYTNTVTGAGNGVSVIPADSVAPITVTAPSNQPPTAHDDSYTTPEDTTLTVAAPGVLGNDTDPEGDALTAVLGAGPSHGSLTLNADGSLTYVPVTNYNGPDSFTYRAADASHQSNLATVSITVTPVSDPIVPHDDAYTTPENSTLTIAPPGVLANDSNPDGRPADPTVQTNVSHGTLALASSGGFVYTPAADFVGDDTFTYSDPGMQTDIRSHAALFATVTISVTHVDQAPHGVADAYSTPEDTPLQIAAPGVLGNDTDADGDSLSAAPVTSTTHGTLTLNGDGGFAYVPATNYNGTDHFTYRASDGSKTSAPTTVTITVTPKDDPPVGVGDRYTTPQDTTLTVDAPGVLHNDTDVDSSTLTAVAATAPAHGTLSLHTDGSFRYVPDSGFSGADAFTYRDSDGTATSRPITVQITVTAVVPPPTSPPPTSPPPGPPLAGTGTATGPLTSLGLLLLLAGALVLAVARRRRIGRHA